MENIHDYSNLLQIKKYIKRILEEKGECKCPVCKQNIQVYKRKITANSAKALIIILNNSTLNDDVGNYIHIQKLFEKHNMRATAMDYIQLSRFGLIEKSNEEVEGKKDSGFWRVTKLGVLFVLGKVNIPAYATVYNNRTIAYSEDKVYIWGCLKKKFIYEEILNYDYLRKSARE